MSITDIDNRLDALRAEAERIRENMHALSNAVRSNGLLSEEGQEAQLRGERETAAAKIRALREQEDKIVADRILTLERRVFGEASSSGDVIAMRDAADRAEQLETDEEAVRLYQRARTSRDEGLATAVVRRAVSSGFRQTLNAFEQSDPTKAEALNDLTTLIRFRDMPLNLTKAMAYSDPR